MNCKIITFIALCSVCMFTIDSIPNESGQSKHPPKPKPSPDKFILPAPFEEWGECDLLSRIYSVYNCDTGLIGRENGETGSEIAEEVAGINKVSLWRAGGKKQLLVLVETRFAQPYEAGSTGKSVDLALFDRVNNKLNLAAFSSGVIAYREFGRSNFDLAPYKLNSQETAVGVRWSSGINGVGEEFLDLFRLEAGSFRAVFRREMWFEMDPDGRDSILRVIQRPAGMNDLMIITSTYHRDDDGNKVKSGSSAKELWRWNDRDQAYKPTK